MNNPHLIDVLKLPWAIFILDENQHLVDLNLLAQEFFLKELPVGKKLSESINDSIAAHHIHTIDQSLSRGQEFEFSTIRDQRVIMKPLAQNIWILNDISVSFVQARTLEEQQRHLIHSAKLASVGEMAAGIAHEINNPLAIIQAKAAFLAKQLAKSPLDLKRFQEDLDKIQVTCQRISKITKSLQTLTRTGDDGSFVQINLVSVLKDTLEIFQQKMKNSNIKFELSIPETLFAEAYDIQIGQVIVILMNNAIDAVASHTEAWIKLSVFEQGQNIFLISENSGAPLPLEVQARLGQAFFSTKEAGKGTGLGVSISKKIMAKHGGALDYDATSPHPRFVAWWPKRQEVKQSEVA